MTKMFRATVKLSLLLLALCQVPSIWATANEAGVETDDSLTRQLLKRLLELEDRSLLHPENKDPRCKDIEDDFHERCEFVGCNTNMCYFSFHNYVLEVYFNEFDESYTFRGIDKRFKGSDYEVDKEPYELENFKFEYPGKFKMDVKKVEYNDKDKLLVCMNVISMNF